MRLPGTAGARVLALGAYLKNTACLLDGDQVLWSPPHGDLGTPEACAALEASAASLLARAGGRIDAVAHDLHPDFHSTLLARRLADQLGVPAIAVQHHHAHIAAVQAEQGLTGPVLGLALDGVGLGTDGTAWGGELLLVAGGHARRLAHLPVLALPGGDIAAREPWRMAAAALHALGRADEIEPRLAPAVGAQAARLLRQMLDRGLNCPATTAAGRWFDAVAGLLGFSVRQSAEAEAAIALERAATAWLADRPAEPAPGVRSLDLRAMLPSLIDDAEPGRAAARFHLGLAAALAATATRAARELGIAQVVLGGGCFFNRLLAEQVPARLRAASLTAWLPRTLSCGDAGLALGQAWVAARMILPSPSQGEGQGGGRSAFSATPRLAPTET